MADVFLTLLKWANQECCPSSLSLPQSFLSHCREMGTQSE